MQRRTFVKSSAGAVAASSTAFAAANRVLGANDKIRCAVLGVNGRGQGSEMTRHLGRSRGPLNRTWDVKAKGEQERWKLWISTS